MENESFLEGMLRKMGVFPIKGQSFRVINHKNELVITWEHMKFLMYWANMGVGEYNDPDSECTFKEIGELYKTEEET